MVDPKYADSFKLPKACTPAPVAPGYVDELPLFFQI